ncbi:hypothetical protein J6590_083003 [Homalodisca vitripennis]|nr:hypothetical protein J6590_083003 [Homalodisca vitripennis]
MSSMEATETLIARKLKVIRNDKKLKQTLGNFHFIATLQDRTGSAWRPAESGCGLPEVNGKFNKTQIDIRTELRYTECHILSADRCQSNLFVNSNSYKS